MWSRDKVYWSIGELPSWLCAELAVVEVFIHEIR